MKVKHYKLALTLLEYERKQYVKEIANFGNDKDMVRRYTIQLWARICVICVLKILVQGVDVANFYYQKENEDLVKKDIKYDIVPKSICEDVINAVRDNSTKDLGMFKYKL